MGVSKMFLTFKNLLPGEEKNSRFRSECSEADKRQSYQGL